MGEVRTSKSQPQGPAFQEPVQIPTAKVEQAPISASKASKASKPAKVGPVPAHLTKGGKASQCQVLTHRGQCSNPARHPYKGGWTCSTHGKRVAAGKAYSLAKVVKAYDPSLWGGVISKAAKDA